MRAGDGDHDRSFQLAMHRLETVSSDPAGTVLYRPDQVTLTEASPFHEFARQRRRSLGIPVTQLADAVGMSRSWVYRFESGRLVPTLTAAIAVAAALNCRMVVESSAWGGSVRG